MNIALYVDKKTPRKKKAKRTKQRSFAPGYSLCHYCIFVESEKQLKRKLVFTNTFHNYNSFGINVTMFYFSSRFNVKYARGGFTSSASKCHQQKNHGLCL